MKRKKIVAAILTGVMSLGIIFSALPACNGSSNDDISNDSNTNQNIDDTDKNEQQPTDNPEQTESEVSYLGMQAASDVSDFNSAETAKTMSCRTFSSQFRDFSEFSQYRDENFFIDVKLKNPKHFRILSLSLTFADKKITIDRYNFEDGTNFSDIFVKVPAKYHNSKYTRYTISEITYIENSTIKKVPIKINDSILVGIIDIRGDNYSSKVFYETESGYGVGAISDEFIKNGVLTIPSEHNGKPVTEIGKYAFAYVNAKELIIPDSVTRILEGAFYNCKSLEKVTLGSGIEFSGFKSFYGCNNVTYVNYLGTIDSWLNIQFSEDKLSWDKNIQAYRPHLGIRFSNPVYFARDLHIRGELLTEVTIPEGVETIKKCAFMRCKSLTKVTLSDSVKRIECRAFDICSGLTEIDLKNVEYIDYYAITGCWGLTTITIPASVKVILGSGKDSAAFHVAQKLVEVYNLSDLPIVAGQSGYGDVALYADNVYNSKQTVNIKEDKDGLLWYTKKDYSNYIYLIGYNGSKKEISVPLTYEGRRVAIKDCAFAGNTVIEKVTLAEGFTSIPERAFAYCSALKEVVLPSTMKQVGEKAFYYSGISELVLPANCNRIDENAFAQCRDLHLTVNAINLNFGYRPFLNSHRITIDYSGTVDSWLASTEKASYSASEGFRSVFYGAYNFSVNCLGKSQENTTTDDDSGYEGGIWVWNEDVGDFVEVIREFILPAGNAGNILTEHYFDSVNGSHCGIDLGADVGSEVLASLDGFVKSIEVDPVNGNTVTILHDNGYKSICRYVNVKEEIKEGDYIFRGDVIGTVSDPVGEEKNLPSHVHFMIQNEMGKFVDPLTILITNTDD